VRKSILLVLVGLAVLLFAGCRDDTPPNLVNSLEDVPGRDIGALYGTPSARLASDLGIYRTYYSGDDLISALKIGAVDCVIMEYAVATELVSGTSGVKILSERLLEYDLRFAVPRENAQLLRVVNTALSALHDNGTLRGLRDRYFAGRNYEYVSPEGVEQRPGYLTLALPPDSPPYSFRGEDGEFYGFDVDVARAVCDFLGVELRIIEEEARELITAVWFGRADLAMGWLPDDVDEQVSISEPYADTSQVVIVRR